MTTVDQRRLLNRRRTDAGPELERLLSRGLIDTWYQPIVELASEEPVGFEALARGPQDSPLHMPGALFGAAARHGRMAELDWACRAAALNGALESEMCPPLALFINVEPIAAVSRVPAQFAEVVQRAQAGLRVVFELTERSLTKHPAEVLRAVDELRKLGALIALDDVGVDPRSLALMPFLRPEVIKLDMRLVQDPLGGSSADTMHAVNAHAEAFDTIILAEGIETEEHLARARALGATHGQGWLFGHPAPGLKGRAHPPLRPLVTAMEPPQAVTEDDTPYRLARRAIVKSRTGPLELIQALIRQLEEKALAMGPECVVLANLQALGTLSAEARDRCTELQKTTAFASFIRHGDDVSRTHERLHRELSICVIGPHFAAALVASDLTGHVDDTDHAYEYRLTYQRDLVVDIARLTMAAADPMG